MLVSFRLTLARIGAACFVIGLPTDSRGGETGACRRSRALAEALTAGAHAVLIASVLHDGHTTVTDLKRALAARGVDDPLTLEETGWAARASLCACLKAEAGLEELAAARAIRVPEVLAVDGDALVLERIAPVAACPDFF